MESSSQPEKIGVVVHAEKTLGGGLEELRSALADAGHADPPWYEIPKSKKAPKAIRKMVKDDGVDRVLVWGGDGTVRRAIDTVISRKLDASIAILPAGTANLLASNLDIPIDLRAAVDIAVHGEARPIDVGQMNGEYFAVMAGAGFDALMIRDAEEGSAEGAVRQGGLRGRRHPQSRRVPGGRDDRGRRRTVVPRRRELRPRGKRRHDPRRVEGVPRRVTRRRATERRRRGGTVGVGMAPAHGQCHRAASCRVLADRDGHGQRVDDLVRSDAALGGRRRRSETNRHVRGALRPTGHPNLPTHEP